MSCSRTQCSDADEALNRGPLVWSQALYHWTTALPKCCVALNTPNHWGSTVFAFMNKSFAPMPRFYAQVICNWGFLINMCEQQGFVFCNKRLQKMVYRLNQTRDELHIHIYILGDKKNCSLRRYFWVPTNYVLVAALKVCCKDISFIVMLFDLWNSCKRLQNSSHICNHGFIFLVLKKAVSLRQHFWIWYIFLSFQRYKLN